MGVGLGAKAGGQEAPEGRVAGGGPQAPAGTGLSLLPGGRACPDSRRPAPLRASAPTQLQTRVPPEGPCQPPPATVSATSARARAWGGGGQHSGCLPPVWLQGLPAFGLCPLLGVLLGGGSPGHQLLTGCSMRPSFIPTLTPSFCVVGSGEQAACPLQAVMPPIWQEVPDPHDSSVEGPWEEWGAGSAGWGQPQSLTNGSCEAGASRASPGGSGIPLSPTPWRRGPPHRLFPSSPPDSPSPHCGAPAAL